MVLLSLSEGELTVSVRGLRLTDYRNLAGKRKREQREHDEREKTKIDGRTCQNKKEKKKRRGTNGEVEKQVGKVETPGSCFRKSA